MRKIDRLSRYRATPALRELFADPRPAPEIFLYPVFVIEGVKKKIAIDSMPGQERITTDLLAETLKPVFSQGIGGVILFGVPDGEKDETGTAAYGKDSLVCRAVGEIRKHFPDRIVATDVCLCGYTQHGHCGVLDENGVLNHDASAPLLAEIALRHAESGADIVAPSAMIDGQIAAIRQKLDSSGFCQTLLMSYSTKFASACYGPFREAANSAPSNGDRKSYQADYSNPRLALRESIADEEEGADILMVKPGLFYLDIIHQIRSESRLPLAAYNVSGEYSMIWAASERGWCDRNDMARESLIALNRAGAGILISYWAKYYNEIFKIQGF